MSRQSRPTLLHSPLMFRMQYLGLLVFMIGDGVEVGYLSPFLVSTGLSEHDVALMFTLYGVVAACAAGCSGVLCERIGVRRTMAAGLVLWMVPQVVFLGLGLRGHVAWVLLASYAVRGAGYPLFAYGLLTLLVKSVEKSRLGLAVGLFWFCFSCGLPTLGTVAAQFLLPLAGPVSTLWIALAAVALGGLIAIGLLPAVPGAGVGPGSWRSNGIMVRAVIGVVRENPVLGLACAVRAINSSPSHGIVIFMPLYFTRTLHLPMSRWLIFLEVIFASNIVFNLLVGTISDFLSWRQTIVWVGGVGSAVSCLGLYWMPSAFASGGGAAFDAAAVLFGMTLAGYVPLSALTPSLLPQHEGVAMSALNLGAGCSVWLGPLIVYLFEPVAGVKGVILIYSGLFLSSAVMARYIVPGKASSEPRLAMT